MNENCLYPRYWLLLLQLKSKQFLLIFFLLFEFDSILSQAGLVISGAYMKVESVEKVVLQVLKDAKDSSCTMQNATPYLFREGGFKNLVHEKN